MIAKDLISAIITPLKTSDSGQFALNLMEELKISHLPIVNETELLGVISEFDILDFNAPDEPIGNHNLSLNKIFAEQNQHIFDIIKLFSDLKLTILPVLDEKRVYLGSITLLNLIHNLANIFAINNPGGIIILEINLNDYVLSEISQIVESNDAKILSLYIHTFNDSTKMEVVIKINKIDISSILQTFYRYNYTVKASYSEKELDEDLIQRYNILMNYLNI